MDFSSTDSLDLWPNTVARSAVWTSHTDLVWRTSHICGMNYVLHKVWKSYSLNSYHRYETRWDEDRTLLVWTSYRCFCSACHSDAESAHVSCSDFWEGSLLLEEALLWCESACTNHLPTLMRVWHPHLVSQSEQQKLVLVMVSSPLCIWEEVLVSLVDTCFLPLHTS